MPTDELDLSGFPAPARELPRPPVNDDVRELLIRMLAAARWHTPEAVSDYLVSGDWPPDVLAALVQPHGHAALSAHVDLLLYAAQTPAPVAG